VRPVTARAPALPRPYRLPVTLAVAAAAWLTAWFAAWPLAEWLSYGLLRLERGSAFGETVAFFLFDVPKVLLLLTGIVWLVAIVRSFFQPERVRAALAGRNVVVGTVAAALFGIVTPFCSCSAVPLFIGFVGVGIPLGVTFAFLVSSPMVNEVALVLLWGLFGPAVALAYMAAGLAVAIVAGLVIGRLGLERYIEAHVLAARSAGSVDIVIEQPTWSERTAQAWDFTRDLVRKILPYILVGIGVGAFVHGYLPTDVVVSLGGRDNPLAVPIVVLLGVPLYSNAAGTIPIVQALMEKGLPLGTTLAFMMAVTALSLPEFIILRRVMRPQLLAVFGAVVASGILVIGYLFNAFA
jgi:uncharacterized protein